MTSPLTPILLSGRRHWRMFAVRCQRMLMLMFERVSESSRFMQAVV